MSERPDTRRAVMYDVARLAGVSHQTVSRVINNHGNVRDATRQRVLEAMAQLDYRPNALARGLASRRSRTIGVLCFDTRLYGPGSTLHAIERHARAQGYSVTITNVDDLGREPIRRAIESFADRSVDGLIVIAPHDSAAIAVRAAPSRVPTVAVEASIDSTVVTVSVNQVSGAAMATDHLLACGYRRIWHLAGPADWPEAQERVEGWRKALTDAGLPAVGLLRGDWSPASGLELAAELIGKADAVFVANDQMALGVLRALAKAGIDVPAEMGVVGFDDIPEAGYFMPALTTVRQDFDEVGRRGLQTLIGMIDEKPPDAALQQQVEPTLVVRETTR
jgi:DNA-binding LacI/PurR family transcriptional regulator